MERYCTNCGTKIQEGAAFCEKCGKPIGKSKKSEKRKRLPVIIPGIFISVFAITVVICLLFVTGMIGGDVKKTDHESVAQDSMATPEMTSQIPAKDEEIASSAEPSSDTKIDATPEPSSDTEIDATMEPSYDTEGLDGENAPSENPMLSKDHDAKVLYMAYLIKEQAKDGDGKKFALIDIDADGISEIVYTADDGYHVTILAYVNGEVKEVGNGFAGKQKYYPNKGIYYSETSHGCHEKTHFIFDGKEMKAVAYLYDDNVFEDNPIDYYIGENKVTKEKYKKHVKIIMKGAKAEKLLWHKNNAKNRKKYLGITSSEIY